MNSKPNKVIITTNILIIVIMIMSFFVGINNFLWIIYLSIITCGIILIVYHKESKSISLNLANGIIALIPIINIICIILSIIILVDETKKPKVNNNNNNDLSSTN